MELDLQKQLSEIEVMERISLGMQVNEEGHAELYQPFAAEQSSIDDGYRKRDHTMMDANADVEALDSGLEDEEAEGNDANPDGTA